MEAAEQALKVAAVAERQKPTPPSNPQRRLPGRPDRIPAMTDTVARQRLELRKVAADQASREAQQRIDGAIGAQKARRRGRDRRA